MPDFLLSAEATFSAAHTLPGVDMCSRMHGHNWRVRCTVRFDERVIDDSGMGIDFRDLERLVRDSVEDFEHRYLNELPEFADLAPSAEVIARIVAERVGHRLSDRGGIAVDQVELWELPQYRVVFRP